MRTSWFQSSCFRKHCHSNTSTIVTITSSLSIAGILYTICYSYKQVRVRQAYHTIPYHTIPYHTVPSTSPTIPYNSISYYTIPHHTIYHSLLHHTIPYHINLVFIYNSNVTNFLFSFETNQMISYDGWLDNATNLGVSGIISVFQEMWPSWRLDHQGYLPQDLKDRGVSAKISCFCVGC